MFCDRPVSLVSDDEDAGGGFDDVVGDGVELVDPEYPVDLGEESLETVGAEVERVEVTKIEGGTFYAEITLQTQYGRRVLDARPSDSIALAARVDAPIWVADEVLAEAGIADETEGSHEDEEAKLAEFKRFLEEVDPEDFHG